eukprot:268295-Alexandrium_andersonii.AAC.1
MPLSRPRVAPCDAAVSALAGLQKAPGLVSGPVIHACFAIPDFWAIARVSTLAYSTCVNPIVVCSSVLASRALAVLALGCSGITPGQRRGATGRRKVHMLIRAESWEAWHEGVAHLLGFDNQLDAFHDLLRLVPGPDLSLTEVGRATFHPQVLMSSWAQLVPEGIQQLRA